MSRFYKPRLSNVVVFALFCINSSCASPVANAERSSVSVVAAYEPVTIIPIDELPPHPSFPSGGSSTTDDGTTVTTTFNVSRDRVRKRKVNEVVSVSEPVNVVPIDRFPPGQLITGGSSSTTNDGTTVTTTFIPGNVMQNPTNATKSTNPLSLINTTLTQPALDMGLNCEGSRLMCLGATQMGVMHTLRDYMYAIPQGYHYYGGQKIACMKHNVYPSPIMTWGFYCAFMQGNIPTDGFDGAEIELKMQQMIEHSCLGCGSVPFSPDNDPRPLGILTVNYVSKSECEGLCYYVPPGVAANAAKVPQGMTLVAKVPQGLTLAGS